MGINWSLPHIRYVGVCDDKLYLITGPVYVKPHVKTILTLWHEVFPHSQSQLSTEIEAGTAVSWKHLLETRSNALSCKYVRVCDSHSPTSNQRSHCSIPIGVTVKVTERPC